MKARVAAVAAVVLIVAGCGDDHAGRRAVGGYVSDVNRVELDMRGALVELQRTNGQFSTKDSAKTHARAVSARKTIRRLERELQRLRPPKEAAQLHARLLSLVAAELSLAREVESLSLFLPRVSVALAPMQAIQQRLNAALRAAKGRAAQADALERYAAALDGPVAGLRALHPPPLSEPVRDGQLRTLVRVRALALELAHAVRTHQNARLPALERRFAAAARSDETVSAQKARIVAIVAYNKRVARLGELAASVQQERKRLDKSLR